MRVFAEIDPADLVRVLKGVANGLRVGDFRNLINETANRSSYSKQQIRMCLGLIATYWARAILADLEFQFSDKLVIKNEGENFTETVELNSSNFYARLTAQLVNLDSSWLDRIAKTYSSEYRQIIDAMPITGEFDVTPPVIDLKDPNAA